MTHNSGSAEQEKRPIELNKRYILDIEENNASVVTVIRTTKKQMFSWIKSYEGHEWEVMSYRLTPLPDKNWLSSQIASLQAELETAKNGRESYKNLYEDAAQKCTASLKQIEYLKQKKEGI